MTLLLVKGNLSNGDHVIMDPAVKKRYASKNEDDAMDLLLKKIQLPEKSIISYRDSKNKVLIKELL